MNAPNGVEVDHKDGNGLNNVRSNLRFCTASQNKMNMRCWNKHGFKGVTFMKRRGLRCWRAKLTINKIVKHLGYFYCLHEAALAYNKAAKKYFGRFARLNAVPS